MRDIWGCLEISILRQSSMVTLLRKKGKGGVLGGRPQMMNITNIILYTPTSGMKYSCLQYQSIAIAMQRRTVRFHGDCHGIKDWQIFEIFVQLNSRIATEGTDIFPLSRPPHRLNRLHHLQLHYITSSYCPTTSSAYNSNLHPVVVELVQFSSALFWMALATIGIHPARAHRRHPMKGGFICWWCHAVCALLSIHTSCISVWVLSRL